MARTKEQAKTWIQEHPQHIVTEAGELEKRLEQTPGPITLELGMGSGDMLVAMAGDFPEQTFLGLEMKEERCLKMAQKAIKAGRENCWCFCAPAFVGYPVLEQHPVDTLWITFPDPWPKKHHWRNRFITFHSVNTILGLIKPGGTLYFKTDHEGLFDWTHMILRHSDCEITYTTRDLQHSDFPLQYLTAFERRYHTLGKPIYLLAARNGKSLPE